MSEDIEIEEIPHAFCGGCDGMNLDSDDAWCDECVDGSLWVKTGTFGCDPELYNGLRYQSNIHLGYKE